jgi:hypothetical protein
VAPSGFGVCVFGGHFILWNSGKTLGAVVFGRVANNLGGHYGFGAGAFMGRIMASG